MSTPRRTSSSKRASVQGASGPEGAGGYFYLKSRVAAVGQDQNLYDFIAKPLEPQELVSVLAELTAQKRP